MEKQPKDTVGLHEDVSYLLTTKLFCGKCGTLMGGESGTSHMGNTYYYYKCGNAKRHGKAHCDLKAIRKEPLERFVVETAIKVIFSDEIIERLIDLVIDVYKRQIFVERSKTSVAACAIL